MLPSPPARKPGRCGARQRGRLKGCAVTWHGRRNPCTSCRMRQGQALRDWDKPDTKTRNLDLRGAARVQAEVIIAIDRGLRHISASRLLLLSLVLRSAPVVARITFCSCCGAAPFCCSVPRVFSRCRVRVRSLRVDFCGRDKSLELLLLVLSICFSIFSPRLFIFSQWVL